jgi:hypothetical protein
LSHFAYAAKQGDKYYVVYDGQKSEGYDYVSEYDLIFSPDSKHFAYIMEKDDKYYVIYDGQKSEGYDHVVPG